MKPLPWILIIAYFALNIYVAYATDDWMFAISGIVGFLIGFFVVWPLVRRLRRRE